MGAPIVTQGAHRPLSSHPTTLPLPPPPPCHHHIPTIVSPADFTFKLSIYHCLHFIAVFHSLPPSAAVEHFLNICGALRPAIAAHLFDPAKIIIYCDGWAPIPTAQYNSFNRFFYWMIPWTFSLPLAWLILNSKSRNWLYNLMVYECFFLKHC